MTRPIRPPDDLHVQAMNHARVLYSEMQADPTSRASEHWDEAEWMAVALIDLASDGDPDRRRLVCSILESNELLRCRAERAEHERDQAVRDAESLVAQRADHLQEIEDLAREARTVSPLIVFAREQLLRIEAVQPRWRFSLRKRLRALIEFIDRTTGIGTPAPEEERCLIDRLRAEEAAP